MRESVVRAHLSSLVVVGLLACGATRAPSSLDAEPPPGETGGSGGASPAPERDAAAGASSDGASVDAAPDDATIASDAGADLATARLDAAGPPATSSAACGSGMAAPAAGAHEIMVGGEARKFLLRVPSTYDGKKPWPVIFIFHGAGQSDTYFYNSTDLRATTEEKAVLVFPDGPVKPDGRRSWVFRSPDNVLFVDALIDWLKTNLCIDPSRLFATGLSSGGYMSVTLACQRGDVFRAVASCSGGMVEHENCRGNPTVWLRTGKADQQTTIDSVTMARDFWLDHKGCARDNPKPLAGIPCVRYGGCTDGSSVVFCTDPGGHGWPSYLSKAIWSEFSQL